MIQKQWLEKSGETLAFKKQQNIFGFLFIHLFIFNGLNQVLLLYPDMVLLE